MKNIIDYDKKNPESIEAYAKKLIGKTFQDVINDDINNSIECDNNQVVSNSLRSSECKRNKGNLGQIIEERYFTVFSRFVSSKKAGLIKSKGQNGR